MNSKEHCVTLYVNIFKGKWGKMCRNLTSLPSLYIYLHFIANTILSAAGRDNKHTPRSTMYVNNSAARG